MQETKRFLTVILKYSLEIRNPNKHQVCSYDRSYSKMGIRHLRARIRQRLINRRVIQDFVGWKER